MKRKYILIALGATLPMLMFHYVYGEVGQGSKIEYQRSYNEIDGDSTSEVTVTLDTASLGTKPTEVEDTEDEILLEEEIFQYSRFKHYTPIPVDSNIRIKKSRSKKLNTST